MDAVIHIFPIPEEKPRKPFLMPVEDVFSITVVVQLLTGRGSRERRSKTSEEV